MAFTLEDRLAVHELCARYGLYFDRGDVEAWIALFADGVELEVPGKKMRGAEQCARFARRMFETTQGKWRHQITNVVVSGGGDDRASISAYGMVTDWRAPAKLVMMVAYMGVAVRDGCGWKFESLKAERA